MTTPWPQAVLFDLDGTLVDSAPDIQTALNATLASYGEPPFELEQVTAMIGRGVPTLIERAYAALGKEIDPATRDKVVERFEAIYGPQSTQRTVLNAGAVEGILALQQRGWRLGVVTNKAAAATETVLAHFGLADHMAIVVGGDAGPERKPAPGLLLLAAEKLGLAPSDIVFVGDSDNDVIAAEAAGMTAIVMRGGYSTRPVEDLGADLIADRLDALPSLIEGLARARQDGPSGEA
ncbi:phosphoglycolate phosphatase [Aurantimonas sp. MSK8Z-1]|uniref:phosphoglycolate phosphatase n=1 Tax=Mangrovibrevibacter kandeliae TaxID=2968473 RepID=UPI002118BA43|nr:phosphoglycolate phosphatase [Aurantimonas sp. MSK8Z-1]MCW4116153.1 phosphoglycolate phosphatase [Aurantimonas sp. MSK8Z-1]